MPLEDMLFSCASSKSIRRFQRDGFATDLREAQTKGFIKDVPHFNLISRYLEQRSS